MELALGKFKTLKIYTSVANEVKLKIRKLSGLIPVFVEGNREKRGRKAFWPIILNRVKEDILLQKT